MNQNPPPYAPTSWAGTKTGTGAPMGHDPLCTWRQAEEADAGDSRRWLAGGLAVCDCELIAQVREDERRQSANDYVDGERDMLAKCIAAVETRMNVGDRFIVAEHVIDDMRALQEKP